MSECKLVAAECLSFWFSLCLSKIEIESESEMTHRHTIITIRVIFFRLENNFVMCRGYMRLCRLNMCRVPWMWTQHNNASQTMCRTIGTIMVNRQTTYQFLFRSVRGLVACNRYARVSYEITAFRVFFFSSFRKLLWLFYCKLMLYQWNWYLDLVCAAPQQRLCLLPTKFATSAWEWISGKFYIFFSSSLLFVSREMDGNSVIDSTWSSDNAKCLFSITNNNESNQTRRRCTVSPGGHLTFSTKEIRTTAKWIEFTQHHQRKWPFDAISIRMSMCAALTTRMNDGPTHASMHCCMRFLGGCLMVVHSFLQLHFSSFLLGFS